MTLDYKKPTLLFWQAWIKGLGVFALGSLVGWVIHVQITQNQNDVANALGTISTCLNAHKLYAKEGGTTRIAFPPNATAEFNERTRQQAGLIVQERKLQELGNAYLGGHIVPTRGTPATILMFKDHAQIITLCGFKEHGDLNSILSQKPRVDLTLSIVPRDDYSMVLIGNVSQHIRNVLSRLIVLPVPQ